MKIKLAVLLLTGLLAATGFVRAQDETNQIARIKEAVQLAKNLKYQQGEIDLRGGLAKLSVRRNLIFLGPDDTETGAGEIVGQSAFGKQTPRPVDTGGHDAVVHELLGGDD